MKSHWRDRSGYAASGACSAPNSGKKERSAWLPPASGTNSCAGTRKSKVDFREGKTQLPGARRFESPQTARNPQAKNSRDSHGLQCKEFLMSFLLAHCGGGQDQPGCLGPSAKRPGSVSRELKRNAVPSERSEFESILDSTLCGNDLAYPSHSFPALSFRIFLLRAFELISPAIQRFFSKLLRLLEVSGARTASRVRHSHQRRGPLPLRRLYFRAGDFHRASERG